VKLAKPEKSKPGKGDQKSAPWRGDVKKNKGKVKEIRVRKKATRSKKDNVHRHRGKKRTKKKVCRVNTWQSRKRAAKGAHGNGSHIAKAAF